jgi:O-antigen biosynthesis protein
LQQQQHIIAALRVKNEARWISRVLKSIQPVCERIIILDDHSTDSTPEICEALGAQVIRSPFQGLNESRDKDFLLTESFKHIPVRYHGRLDSPYWMLAVDGDEELVANDQPLVQHLVKNPAIHCYALRILYLWDDPQQWRVDGVYRDFRRPSLVRLINPAFRYKTTPWGNGANFHCSSIPQEMLHYARPSDARLLHWGYIDRDLRLRKYHWYNSIDPNNAGEDCYRHVIQGDVPEIPADARLKWAGPLELRAI